MMYDYHCPNCGNVELDKIVKLSDADSQHCSNCGSIMNKKIGTPAFMFKHHSGTSHGRIMQIAKKKQ